MSHTAIRVRFAPSPTGYLHVGGLRTALYNYLLAKKHQGCFILRIEDTDQARYVEGAVENLIHTLEWCGIRPDEGPYYQSQRLTIYQQYAQELIERGAAYRCFCTPEELETMRAKMEADKLPPKYDGRCRYLSRQEIQDRLKAGMPSVIRLRMPENEAITFQDQIRGEVAFQSQLIDDQILIKSDGYPTYHLANVIDDHLMGITHVIRGEEWLPSTPKHIVLYRALGWQIPEFAHLPLLLNHDRSKLSKRQGDVAVEDYQRKGYLPEAMLNFIALLGWNPGTEQELFSLDELISLFSLDRVNKAGAVFDLNKLNWVNAQYMKHLSADSLRNLVWPFLIQSGRDLSDTGQIERMIAAVRDSLQKGDDIVEATEIFYRDTFEINQPEAVDILKNPLSQQVLYHLAEKMAAESILDKTSFLSLTKVISQITGAKKADLWMPIRIALTGVMHGPELTTVIEIFGREKCIKQLQHIIGRYAASVE
ncbi:MAG: glutamate--tRNA ligase [Candidatus Delongbacteria bacterium]|nr:glutamate--tRNA ligase [Candidatus Delongbacteria bacterium]